MPQSPSFIRTDKAIEQAFIELLEEKPFEKITVQDILERTPVTRATFYAHFHDKYELAERMLSQFVDICCDVRNDMSKLSDARLTKSIRQKIERYQSFSRALLNINYENLSLRKVISDIFKKEYLAENGNGKNAAFEADIYAQARAELELIMIKEDGPVLSFDEYNSIFTNVSLKLLRIGDDKETRRFIEQKIEQNLPQMVLSFNSQLELIKK